MNNKLFVKEMRILWKNAGFLSRKTLENMIKRYFEGDRADKIIKYLQEKIEG